MLKHKSLTIKDRAVLLFLNVLMFFLMLAFVYVGVDSIKTYLSYPNRIEYSSIQVGFVFSFVVIAPLFLLGLPVIFKGEKMNERLTQFFCKVMLFGLLLVISSGLMFRVYYINEIESRGYIECPAKLIGAFSGLTTQYATSEVYCKR
ncbi:hypothetical protein GW590_07085 [Rahnella sp. SAP-1]|uniref:DUF1240 domain-containing protein n=1 Tax=Rouxiella aceris TaxID=2703884 RepID=A0A848MK58_9GAMM|nr:hypothetical protein [Rouxiella aceris]NMP26624.1 hypothetical protein [Rouxiella aceris]